MVAGVVDVAEESWVADVANVADVAGDAGAK